MEEQLAKFFSGESTQDEREEIIQWRNESDDNAKAFLEAKNIWFSSESKPTANPQVLADIFNQPSGKSIQLFSSKWMKYAAAAVVVLGLSVTLWLFKGRTGDLMVQRLEDGSEITLHQNSKISSIVINEKIREVSLQGKGYFNITSDESRPFIVRTEDARIEVLGTSFVINTYNERTEVSVESGLVSLIKPGKDGKTDLSVKLTKGETGTVTDANKGILKKNNHDPNSLAWKTKMLVFDRTKMSEVEETLEDVYNIDIVFQNPFLGNCNLTATFKERKAKDAIAIIAKTFNLTFDIKGDQVILMGKGC